MLTNTLNIFLVFQIDAVSTTLSANQAKAKSVPANEKPVLKPFRNEEFPFLLFLELFPKIKHLQVEIHLFQFVWQFQKSSEQIHVTIHYKDRSKIEGNNDLKWPFKIDGPKKRFMENGWSVKVDGQKGWNCTVFSNKSGRSCRVSSSSTKAGKFKEPKLDCLIVSDDKVDGHGHSYIYFVLIHR